MLQRNCQLLIAVLAVAVLAAAAAEAPYRVYWGDLHGHTANSDGKGSLDDYFVQARDVARLDFAVVSDHDFGNGAPWRLPKETWTLTQDKVDQYTADGTFVAIAGYEWTSQAKYWTPEEPLFAGPGKFYNHKNVYFPARLDYLFSAKDPLFNNPDLLADAVQKAGGLIHNNHPDASPGGRDQFDYTPAHYAVIVNTEMWPDTVFHQGKTHNVDVERTVRGFLNRGGMTGFVAGSDTHDGKPAARTAVLARELTRPAILAALRQRRNYAVLNARIILDFRIDGHFMGEEITVDDTPRITVAVRGTDLIEEAILVRDGTTIHTVRPGARDLQFEFVDRAFAGNSYYYVRVIQADTDEHGNHSHAWSSPIWVRQNGWGDVRPATAPYPRCPGVTAVASRAAGRTASRMDDSCGGIRLRVCAGRLRSGAGGLRRHTLCTRRSLARWIRRKCHGREAHEGLMVHGAARAAGAGDHGRGWLWRLRGRRCGALGPDANAGLAACQLSERASAGAWQGGRAAVR